MGRRIAAAGVALAALLFASLPSAVSAAAGGPARTLASSLGHSTDNPAQTFGAATFYGTSSPLAAAAAPAGARSALTHRDTRVARVFAHHASRTARRNASVLQPPSPAGTPVVSNPGSATGFRGLSHADQRLAGTLAYVNTQFSLEPPDQGLCVGRGFVIEPINDAFVVYSESGKALTGVNALNQFYKRSPAFNRVTGKTGDFLSDPKCYYDPVGQRFIQTILEVDAPGNFNAQAPFNRTHVLIAVSQTSNPTGAWNLFSLDTSDDGLNGTPAHTGCPCLPDQPLLGANRDGVFIDVNEFQDNANFFFNGGQIFALGRAALESSTGSVGFVHLNVGTVPTCRSGVRYSPQPHLTPAVAPS